MYEHSGLRDEHIYLGGYELYRQTTISTDVVEEERETVHISDDVRRVCMVETKTRTGGNAVGSPVSRFRYQLDDHLGSACVEVDENGALITFEEYFPYGTSSFRSADSTSGVSAKRYRYTGKERDESTGLYYHSARYYAPWLGRWTAADPLAFADGVGSYTYVRGSPVVLSDPSGRDALDDQFSELQSSWATAGPNKLPKAPPSAVEHQKLAIAKNRLLAEVKVEKAKAQAAILKHQVTTQLAKAEAHRQNAEKPRMPTPTGMSPAEGAFYGFGKEALYAAQDIYLGLEAKTDPANHVTTVTGTPSQAVEARLAAFPVGFVKAKGGAEEIGQGAAEGDFPAIGAGIFKVAGFVLPLLAAVAFGRARTPHRTSVQVYGQTVRGFKSPQTVVERLNNLKRRLAEAGVKDAKVGIRGSSVTGENSRTGAPFHDGSDIDFYFTSPSLEARFRATKHITSSSGAVRPADLASRSPKVQAALEEFGVETSRMIRDRPASVRLVSEESLKGTVYVQGR